jgi:hypothetical protein
MPRILKRFGAFLCKYKYVNLIIAAGLSEIPSESWAFRELTSDSKYKLNLSVLLEVNQQFKDSYYYHLKHLGLMDFVDDMINEFEEECGIYVGLKVNRSPGIKIDRICSTNQFSLFEKISRLTSC